MLYVKGKSGNPAGRPKGLKNRAYFLKSTIQVLSEMNLNPAEALAKIANETDDDKVRVAALKELFSRSETPMKHVEHSLSEETLERLEELANNMKGLVIEYKREY